jgi:hypothetical protein
MDSKEFKRTFSNLANKCSFKKESDYWSKTSDESILLLELQKSNFGNYYYINIRIFIRGIFNFDKNETVKTLKKKTMGIFLRQPKEYEDSLNLEFPMEDNKRSEKLETLFNAFVIPISIKALTLQGISELASEGKILITDPTKKELEKKLIKSPQIES